MSGAAMRVGRMTERIIHGRRYLQFARLAELDGLVHAFSTRGCDMSTRGGAGAAQRTANRAAFVGDWGLDVQRLCWCEQVHRPQLTVIDRPITDGPRRLAGCDAVISRVAGQPLMAFSADCPLVLVYAPRVGAVGIAHASWRCTVAQITRRLVETLIDLAGAEPSAMLAGIGPSAGPERYEVGEDVCTAAAGLPERERLFPRRNGRMFFDLWLANRLQLRAAGLQEENIATAGLCTIGAAGMFYSYRREGAGCGHFALLAAVR